MRTSARLCLIALGLVAGSGSASACYRHTFDPCPAAPVAQPNLILDKKTGETHLAARPSEGAVESAVKNFAAGEVVGRQAPDDKVAGDWSTRVVTNAN